MEFQLLNRGTVSVFMSALLVLRSKGYCHWTSCCSLAKPSENQAQEIGRGCLSIEGCDFALGARVRDSLSHSIIATFP
jgi:hypothetical protein